MASRRSRTSARSEEDIHWPDRFDEPVLDGRRLIFSAPEDELQQAWDAVKARVAATNLAYREHFRRGSKKLIVAATRRCTRSSVSSRRGARTSSPSPAPLIFGKCKSCRWGRKDSPPAAS